MDLIGPIMTLVLRDQETQITRGTVVSLSGNRVFVKRFDCAGNDPTAWPKLAITSALVPGDEILMVRCGGGYIVLDKVIR